jgi:hypothetical protein
MYDFPSWVNCQCLWADMWRLNDLFNPIIVFIRYAQKMKVQVVKELKDWNGDLDLCLEIFQLRCFVNLCTRVG